MRYIYGQHKQNIHFYMKLQEKKATVIFSNHYVIVTPRFVRLYRKIIHVLFDTTLIKVDLGQYEIFHD